MMSETVWKHDLTGAQIPTGKFVLTLFGHHDYPPPEPWEYFDQIVYATVDGGVLGYIFGTMIIEAHPGLVMIYLCRKGEELPHDLQILKNRKNLYAIPKEFGMRGAIPILDGVDHILKGINNQFLANLIYVSEMDYK